MQSPLYIAGSNQAVNPSSMTVQSVRAPGATTNTVNTVAGVPTFFMGTMGAPHTFTDPVTGETITVISDATAVDFAGTINAGKIDIVAIAPGYTDTRGSLVGDIIVVRPTTQWADNLFNVINNQALNPAGMITPFAGSSAPANWLMCDGSAISRSTYAALFAVIGSTFGAGDGSTTFNVPDLRGRTPIGSGTGTYAEVVAAAGVTIATDQLTVSAFGAKILLNGQAVVLTTSGTAPAGLTAGNTYYVIAVDATHIKLATSLANAETGTAIDITSQGTGNHTLTNTLTARALADRGGEEGHALVDSEMPRTHIWTGTPGNLNDFANFGSASVQGGWTATSMGANVGQGRLMINGGQGAHNNMQPYLALNYIIKT